MTQQVHGWIHCTQCGWGCQVHRAEVAAGDYHDRQACPHCGIGPCRINWEHFAALSAPAADVRSAADLTKEIESLKQQLEAAHAFHNVAVAERNAAWYDADRLRRQLKEHQARVAEDAQEVGAKWALDAVLNPDMWPMSRWTAKILCEYMRGRLQ